MKNIRFHSFLIGLLLLLTVAVKAASGSRITDPALYEAVKKEAITRLERQMLHNRWLKEHGRADEMRFVVNVEPPAGPPYLIDQGVGDIDPLLKAFGTEKSALEASLAKIYSDHGVEPYMVILNYFQFKLKTVLPKGRYTLDDIFNNGKLDDSLNVAELKADHGRITADIIQGRGLFGDNGDRVVLSVGLYKGYKFGNVETIYLAQVSPNKGSEYINKQVTPLLYSYLTNTGPKLEDKNWAFLRYYVNSLEQSIASSKYKAKILETYTVGDLKDILEHFKSPADFQALSVEERTHCLSLLVSETMLGNYFVNTSEEGLAVSILKEMPKGQVRSMFQKLEAQSPLNFDDKYKGSKDETAALLVRLINKIDDGILFGRGGDNFSKLVTVLLGHFRSVTDAKATVKTIDPAHYYYWYTYREDCFEEGPLALNGKMDDNAVVTLSSIYKYESKCKYFEKEFLESKPAEFSAFQPVVLSFLATPDQDLMPGGVAGKYYVVPAFYVYCFREKRMMKITKLTAINAVELYFAGMSAAELAAARGVKLFITSALFVANSGAYVINSPAITAELMKTPEGAAFHFYYNRCVLIANLVYMSPMALRYARGMVQSFKSLGPRARAAFGNKLGEIEANVDDMAHQLDEAAAAGSTMTRTLAQLKERINELGLTFVKKLPDNELETLLSHTDEMLHILNNALFVEQRIKDMGLMYLRNLTRPEMARLSEYTDDALRALNEERYVKSMAMPGNVPPTNVALPAGLVTKLGQARAAFIKNWATGRVLKYNGLEGAQAEAALYARLDEMVGSKQVIDVAEDGAGRLLVTTERGASTNRVIAIELKKGPPLQHAVNEYAPSYRSSAAPQYDVDLSINKLGPDYTTKGGTYLYPQANMTATQSNVVRIQMTGNMADDFRRANELAGFGTFGNKAPHITLPDGSKINYTWHHLDDFDPATGMCTVQLVQRNVHTAVEGMAHAGGAAQYRFYHGTGYE